MVLAVSPEPLVTILSEVVYNTTERNDSPINIDVGNVILKCNAKEVMVIFENIKPFNGQIYATLVDKEKRLNTIKIKKGNYTSIQMPICTYNNNDFSSSTRLLPCELKFNQLVVNIFIITNTFNSKHLITWADIGLQARCDYRKHAISQSFNGQVEKLFPTKKSTDLITFNSHYSIILEIGDIRRAPGTLANLVDFTFTRIDNDTDFVIKVCKLGIPRLDRWQDIIVDNYPVLKFYLLLYQDGIVNIKPNVKKFSTQLFSLAYDDFSPQTMELRCSFEECPVGGCDSKPCALPQRLKRLKKRFKQKLRPKKLTRRPVRLRSLKLYQK
ncbi:unnamed protein product [Bursaphelenchus okinawaensis]|uniref:Uncharacterized protein n=1 Tax=Bursaphelenchus okinawaensis TaxID=465554 RepID=A0A811KN84_9BILA|nr:unnamed protein product [Bursaphelenchus okinawaensis]CAG9107092.1 unnamed protein product [Bursaphelenchus okinawaensis]